MNTLRDFLASCSLDRPGPARGPFAAVHRELSGAEADMVPTPPGIRARVMDRLYESQQPAPSLAIGWRWGAALAAVLTLAVGVISLMLSRPPVSSSTSALHVPVDAGPMIRLVAGSLDQPMLDQAEKLVNDTKRVTRAVVRCIPFTRGG
jgi:hypothetical protein